MRQCAEVCSVVARKDWIKELVFQHALSHLPSHSHRPDDETLS